MSTASNQSHLIVVALRMAGIAGQDKLNGIFEFLSRGHRWQLSIYRTAHEFTAKTVRHELDRGAEGFIVGIPGTDSALAELARHDVPTVAMNITGGDIERRRSALAFVRSDSAAIGHAAAQELLRQGVYRGFAYAGYRDDADWSRERGIAFRTALQKAGFTSQILDRAHFHDRLDNREILIRWLCALPKPCGIFAACDDRAFELLDACHEAGIAIPDEIGILGVNNDPILCENAEPRLSSVQPDFIREGRLAAEILDRMLTNDRYRQMQAGTVHLVGLRQIVNRDSTPPRSDAGLLVQKAVSFIKRNALRGISVQDVARHLNVSYSLINLRYQHLQGCSIHETILQLRLAEVKRRLRTSTDPIDAIAAACGWSHPNSLKNLFKRRYGLTMRDWRSANRTQPQ